MKYQIAEKFKSIQGEGLYAGTPMAFIRFVGCSVGKRICQHCDTMFEQMLPWQGGGEFTPQELLHWAYPYKHICLTGGEPFDQDLVPLVKNNEFAEMFHVETSGTKSHEILNGIDPERFWICVSPKPGFLEEVVMVADEVKVIVPGLGEMSSALRASLTDNRLLTMKLQGRTWDGPSSISDSIAEAAATIYWPTLQDALRWAKAGKLVYIQPRNGKFDIDHNNLRIVQDILVDHPNLRLSTQMHKILHVQ